MAVADHNMVSADAELSIDEPLCTILFMNIPEHASGRTPRACADPKEPNDTSQMMVPSDPPEPSALAVGMLRSKQGGDGPTAHATRLR